MKLSVTVVLGEAVSRAGVDPSDIDEVVFGAANQAGEDNRNLARLAALLAGLILLTVRRPSPARVPEHAA